MRKPSKSTSKRVAIQRTHWATCWKDPAHHDCAVAYIAHMDAALRDLAGVLRVSTIPKGRGDDMRFEMRVEMHWDDGENLHIVEAPIQNHTGAMLMERRKPER